MQAREAEIVEELSQHLDERYEELRRDGVSEDEARRLAIGELLEPEALGRFMRPLRQANRPTPIVPGAPRHWLVVDLWQDLRYALRMLRTERAFAAAAILTLALGIGVNSAIFALVDTTLLRPLPFPNADRLVLLLEGSRTSRRGGVAPANLADWNERSRSFETMGGFRGNVGPWCWATRTACPRTSRASGSRPSCSTRSAQNRSSAEPSNVLTTSSALMSSS